MRYVNVEHKGTNFAGVLKDDHIIPLDGVSQITPEAVSSLSLVPLQPKDAVEVEAVRFLPPVAKPGKVICIGLNYAPHVVESQRDLPDYPVLFTKFGSALIGAHDSIVKPQESNQVDWEGELAVIIGADARRVPVRDALQTVAGYSVVNDVTMRDYQYKSHQWLQGKTWDRATPIGPALVTADEAGDPSDLRLTVRMNGNEVQAAHTSEMIFDVATLISVISEFTTLRPGDILLTGTPAGVGYRRDPQIFLTPGDVVSVEIDSIGRIENRVVDEADLVSDGRIS